MKLFVYNHVPVSDNISGKPVGFPNGPQLLWSIIILIDKKRAFRGDYSWWFGQLKSGTQGSVVIKINIFNCSKIGSY